MTLLDLYKKCADLNLSTIINVSIDGSEYLNNSVEWYLRRFGKYRVRYFEISTMHFIIGRC